MSGNFATEIMNILENLMDQLILLVPPEMQSLSDKIVEYHKKISQKKLKVDKTVLRMYKILEPYNKYLFNNDSSFLTNIENKVMILPEIDLVVVYNLNNINDDSRSMIFKYLRLVKLYSNVYFGKNVDKNIQKLTEILNDISIPKNGMNPNGLAKAGEEIKKMFGGTEISSGSTNTIMRLVDQITNKLASSNMDDGFDIRGLLSIATEIAQDNKDDFIDGKVDLSEITKSASTIMQQVYNNPDNEIAKQIGFNPMTLLTNMVDKGVADKGLGETENTMNIENMDFNTLLQSTLKDLTPEQQEQMNEVLNEVQSINPQDMDLNKFLNPK
jgi:hypothetical protein